MNHHPIRPACSYGFAVFHLGGSGLLSLSVKTVRLYTGLFLLMTILSQSFLTLVRSHLMAFSFLSAGHNN